MTADAGVLPFTPDETHSLLGIEPVFNRVLIYRSMTLHSADIAEDFDFDPDPRTGRLTVNALFNFV